MQRPGRTGGLRVHELSVVELRRDLAEPDRDPVPDLPARLRTDSSVARIDPRTRAVTHLIELPPGSASAAAVDGMLLITNHDHDAVHVVPLPLPE